MGPRRMTITYHPDVEQGSDAWFALRCGLITASETHLLVTPTLKPAKNDKSRSHVYELAAQRITRYVEPRYIGDDQLRGHADEITARDLYSRHRAPVTETGFVTNDRWGFTLGCSPDGLVGDDGMIECKSRRQKYQVETIVGFAVPAEHIMQTQTALLVTERAWLDYVSFSGGLPMAILRVFPDARIQEAILEAAEAAENAIADLVATFAARSHGMIATERTIEAEMHI